MQSQELFPFVKQSRYGVQQLFFKVVKIKIFIIKTGRTKNLRNNFISFQS